MKSMLKALISGLGQMANIWPKVEVKPFSRTDLEALRSDTRRIGDDMRRAIDKVYADEMTEAELAEMRPASEVPEVSDLVNLLPKK